ncbi:hypothetical protein [Halothiobacillus sp.]|uniref:hypothetical protein n=1 Tax=Halothiobacillus sp. TaxID=1891311 RepID=UPI003D0DFC27
MFKGIKRITSAVNPANIARPGAEIISENVKSLTKKRTNVVPIKSMSDSDRLARVQYLHRSALIVGISGFLLGLIALYTGVTMNMVTALIAALVLTAISMHIALMFSWEAHMVGHNTRLPLTAFIRHLISPKE